MTVKSFQKMYYQLGTLFGLVCALIVATLILRGSLLYYFSNQGVGLSILGGVLSCIFSAKFFDFRRIRAQGTVLLRSTQYAAFKIFLIGICVGCFLNIVLKGRLSPPPYGFYVEFISWFVKPIFWLSLIGIPLSIVTATIYFHVMKFLEGK